MLFSSLSTLRMNKMPKKQQQIQRPNVQKAVLLCLMYSTLVFVNFHSARKGSEKKHFFFFAQRLCMDKKNAIKCSLPCNKICEYVC